MEITQQNTIRQSETQILGEFSKVTENQDNKNKKNKSPTYKIGDIVYLTAFFKKYKGQFFICRGTIKECPSLNTRRIYKIYINAVGDAPVGGEVTPLQASLLGRDILKHETEINKELPYFMMPKKWIEKDP